MRYLRPIRTRGRRTLIASLTLLVALAVIAAPAEAGKPTSGGSTINSVTYDPVIPCKVYVNFTPKRGKFAQIDMWANSWGYRSPTDTQGGYVIWAGSESRNGPLANGSYTAVFDLAAGGHLKEFTTWGWAYRIEGVTLDGTVSPTYSFRSTCVFPNYNYTVKFHDGYTSGDAGFLPALQRTATFGQLIAEPTPPTRAGYTFVGWKAYYQGYLGPHPETGYWDFSTMTMTDFDTVMYAQWV